ncbi:hypothetical protein ACTMU2_17755 [Cupriavidus basilensis]
MVSWQSVVDFLFKEWTAGLDISSSTLKDLEPVDALKVTLRRHIEFVAKRPEIFMIAIVEGARRYRATAISQGELYHSNEQALRRVKLLLRRPKVNSRTFRS